MGTIWNHHDAPKPAQPCKYRNYVQANAERGNVLTA